MAQKDNSPEIDVLLRFSEALVSDPLPHSTDGNEHHTGINETLNPELNLTLLLQTKTDKSNIIDKACAIKNVNDIKIKKSVKQIALLQMGSKGGDIGVKDDCIPFDACCQLFVSEN